MHLDAQTSAERPSHINFNKAEQLIRKVGYVHGVSSTSWGRFYHLKSKKYLSKHLRISWRETLKANDTKKIAARLDPSELREYTNLLDNSIGHYSDWLNFERIKSNVKIHSDLIKFRRRFRK